MDTSCWMALPKMASTLMTRIRLSCGMRPYCAEPSFGAIGLLFKQSAASLSSASSGLPNTASFGAKPLSALPAP